MGPPGAGAGQAAQKAIERLSGLGSLWTPAARLVQGEVARAG